MAGTTEDYDFFVEDFTDNFKWSEYIVFALVLVASLGNVKDILMIKDVYVFYA